MPYLPTKWNDGRAPAINAANLNKIEQGIHKAVQDVEALTPQVSSISTVVSGIQTDVTKHTSEIKDLDTRVTQNANALASLNGALTFRGTWDPANFPNVYPDNPKTGDLWIVKVHYDFQTGDLSGTQVVPGDELAFDGAKWLHIPAGGGDAATLLAKIQTVDGSGSGLDADLLDGLDSTDFVKKAGDTMGGALTTPGIFLDLTNTVSMINTKKTFTTGKTIWFSDDLHDDMVSITKTAKNKYDWNFTGVITQAGESVATEAWVRSVTSGKIEHGGGPNGEWTKFPDGTLLMWGNRDVTLTVAKNVEERFVFDFPLSLAHLNGEIHANVLGTGITHGFCKASVISEHRWDIWIRHENIDRWAAHITWQYVGRWK